MMSEIAKSCLQLNLSHQEECWSQRVVKMGLSHLAPGLSIGDNGVHYGSIISGEEQ